VAGNTFEALFPIAASSRGMSYVQAKSQFLALAGRERKKTLARLKLAGQDSSDWQRQLTALILAGWLERKASFAQCGIFARGDLPGPEPLPGFTAKHRATAIAQLGKEVTPRVLEMLYKNREYADETQRSALFGALVELEDDRAVMPMVALAEDEGTEGEVRVEALNVLAWLGDPRGLDAVLRLANDRDVDAAVREPAIRALAGFGDPRAADGLFDILGNNAVALSDRRAASGALAIMCNPATRERLRAAIPQAEDQQIKLDLIAALGQAGTKEDQPFLAKLAGDEDAATARAAREAMTAIAERE
jgi:hypothetical protein